MSESESATTDPATTDPATTNTALTDPLRWTIGDVTVTRVEENVIPLPQTTILDGVTDQHLADTADWIRPFFREDGKMLLSVHAFVVQSGDTTIVVDTCVGTGERPLPGDEAFLDRLGAAVPGGLEGVDVVLCTHLHFDHVGWNTIERDGEWVPTFPNARYLISEPELASFPEADHNGVAPTSIDPLVAAGQLDAVAMDHEITPQVRLLPTPGHAPGHVSLLIESGGDTALITGDATHSPLQFAYPELSSERFDDDTDQSTDTRRALVSRLLDTDTLVLGTHFAPPTAGHVRSTDTLPRFDTNL